MLASTCKAKLRLFVVSSQDAIRVKAGLPLIGLLLLSQSKIEGSIAAPAMTLMPGKRTQSGSLDFEAIAAPLRDLSSRCFCMQADRNGRRSLSRFLRLLRRPLRPTVPLTLLCRLVRHHHDSSLPIARQPTAPDHDSAPWFTPSGPGPGEPFAHQLIAK